MRQYLSPHAKIGYKSRKLPIPDKQRDRGPQRVVLSLHDTAIALHYPRCCEEHIKALFGSVPPAKLRPCARITIRHDPKKGYSIRSNGTAPILGLNENEFP